MPYLAAPFAAIRSAAGTADRTGSPQFDSGTHHPGLRSSVLRRTWGARSLIAVLVLLAVAAASYFPVATAQVARNGPEWDGKDHQPTRAGVAEAEQRDGVRPPPAQQQEDQRTVEQLGQQLLHDEGVDRSRNPTRSISPP